MTNPFRFAPVPEYSGTSRMTIIHFNNRDNLFGTTKNVQSSIMKVLAMILMLKPIQHTIKKLILIK